MLLNLIFSKGKTRETDIPQKKSALKQKLNPSPKPRGVLPLDGAFKEKQTNKSQNTSQRPHAGMKRKTVQQNWEACLTHD